MWKSVAHRTLPLKTLRTVTAPTRNLIKPFCIAGFILAEVYMVWMVLAPNTAVMVFVPGPMPIPVMVVAARPQFWMTMLRLFIYAIFLGPFGGLVGLGAGLLTTGLLAQIRRLTGKPGSANT